MTALLIVLAATLAVALTACGGEQTTPLGASADPAVVTTTQGRFVLAFTIARATVHPADAIAGAAALTLLTPGSATITGSSDLVVFEFSEVGGNHRPVVPASRAACAPPVVVLPAGNRKDLIEVPEDVQKDLQFVFAERVEDVWREALIKIERGKEGERK